MLRPLEETPELEGVEDQGRAGCLIRGTSGHGKVVMGGAVGK